MAGLLETEPRALFKRGISEETCRKFNYGFTHYKDRPVQVAQYTDANGQPVAQKVRTQDKDFFWTGEPKRAVPFGMALWSGKGRRVVVTEGEIDALSYAEATGCRWEVISVSNGASGAAKELAPHVEWLEGYEEVCLMFDMDEPGRKAAIAVAELLSPGKARICELPRKDANEVLVELGAGVLSKLPWQAKPYRPDGIVDGRELWEVVTSQEVAQTAHYPWLALNDRTAGLRLGELVTVCAGTGIGKSTLCREIAHNLIQQGETVGYIALEESVRRTALGLMSIELNIPLHLRPADSVSEDDKRAAFATTVGSGRLFLYDHWGSVESKRLMSKIRALVRGCGVRWIVLDHISIVISGLEVENERKELDIAMTTLRTLAEELNIGILIVSHLKRVQGRSFERGGEVHLSDLRGSAALEQLSDMVIALERDQQAGENSMKMRLRVLKNRFSGETGLAGALKYDAKTGRLVEFEDPFGEDEEEQEDENGPGEF